MPVKLRNFTPFPQMPEIKFSAFSSAVRRLLSLDSFAGEQADAFFSLSSSTRSLLLQLEDLPLVAALDQGIDESSLLASLDPDGISASREASLPDDPGLSDLERQLILLGDELQAFRKRRHLSGN